MTWDGEDFAVSGNYLNDINIDSATDNLYKQIKARSIQDLYDDINWDEYKTISDGSTTETGEDKLWIPSIAEIYSLVAGGDISTITNDWSAYYDKLKWWGELNFDLRSPYSNSAVYTILIEEDGSSGNWGNNLIAGGGFVRPMFILEV